MLKDKLNLKTIFYLLNIIAIIIYYFKTGIQLIDILYFIFILLFILKHICVEEII